jgi:hypothetical protein
MVIGRKFSLNTILPWKNEAAQREKPPKNSLTTVREFTIFEGTNLTTVLIC